jgi:hypothetical protein
LIFVTHNANIPVLGEADRVIVMQMETPLTAGSPVCVHVQPCGGRAPWKSGAARRDAGAVAS